LVQSDQVYYKNNSIQFKKEKISQIYENGIQSQNRFTRLLDNLLIEHMSSCRKIIILLLKRRFFYKL